MSRTLTNDTQLAYSIEVSLGVEGATWYNVEPNDITTFGAQIGVTARNPISANRQAKKGSVTSLKSAMAYPTDLTRSSFRDHIEGFVFATGINSNVSDLVSTAVSTTLDDYTVAALTAAQANKMEIGTLIWASNFGESANNGLKEVDADIATSATTITVAENLVTEASPPATARISFAGYRVQGASAVTWTWDAGTARATMNLTGLGTQLIALGLTAGQIVHIGSPNIAVTAIQNAFENAAANDMYGHARVVSITANDVVFDGTDAALQFTDAVSPATDVDIIFGEFIRNVATTSSEYLTRTFQYEATFVGLGTGGVDMYSYSKGNTCNSVTFNLPIESLATIAYDWVGTDTDDPVLAASRKSGASAATNPPFTTGMNTSSEIARLRVIDVDESGLTTDFKSATLTLTNGASEEVVLGTLGAKYINLGNFGVQLSTEVIFSESAVINRIRGNTTVRMDFVLKNENGTIAVDIPSMTLGDGTPQFPRDESIKLTLTGTAYQDTTLGTSIGVSISPVPLP